MTIPAEVRASAQPLACYPIARCRASVGAGVVPCLPPELRGRFPTPAPAFSVSVALFC
jgi:hypothetical protein